MLGRSQVECSTGKCVEKFLGTPSLQSVLLTASAATWNTKEDETFLSKIRFSNKATSDLSGMVNRHNIHI
jgi:hypothetical protein